LSLLAEGRDALGKVGVCPHLIAKMLLQGLGGQRLVGDRGADLPLDRNAEAVVFRDARLDYAGLKTRAVSSPGRSLPLASDMATGLPC